MEDRASGRRRFKPDAAAVSLDDRPADGQSDTHAVLLRCDERLEQLFGDRFADSRAGVFDAHAHQIRRLPIGPDGQASDWSIHHRVDRVADQVDENLLNLDPYDENLVGAGVKLDLHFDPKLARANKSKRVRFGNQAREAFDSPLHLAMTDEVAQPPDNLPGPDRLSGGIVKSLAHNRQGFIIRR